MTAVRQELCFYRMRKRCEFASGPGREAPQGMAVRGRRLLARRMIGNF